MTAAPSPSHTLQIPASRHFILGTAGHIDHGKTSLVIALTGTNTDRLPEEQRRGMTIELGFAELVVGDTRFGVVDVPGHERFVRTMVAGATGIDIALLVVAADDSVMPQTVEHVEILHLLGIRECVVAITKIDMVDTGMVELVAEEVRQLLAGTPLGGAAICPVSSVTGAGIIELKQAVHAVSKRIERTAPRTPFRLAVDRVFTVQGRGTVVTGSVLRGQVSAGDTLEVWPSGETCRVRDLQAHGVQHQQLARGQRAAINVSGIDRERLQRGAELATPGYLKPSRMIDVRLRCLASFGRPLKSTATVRLEIGTTEIPVRVVLFDGESLPPGSSGYAQLRSGEPITTAYGQHFILRDASATRTIGGGIVLRPAARRTRHQATGEIEALQRLEHGESAARVAEVLRLAGFTAPTDLQVCARAGVELDERAALYERLKEEGRWIRVQGTDVYATPAAIADVTARVVGWLERHHRAHPDQPGRLIDAAMGWLERVTMNRALARPLFDRLVQAKTVKLLGKFVCSPAFAPSLSAADERLLQSMIGAVRSGGFQPPSLDELATALRVEAKRIARLATLAVALGELHVVAPDLYLHVEVEQRLRAAVAGLIARAGPVSVAQVREELGSSRKYVVPFVEYLDRVGFTKRVGDQRVLCSAEKQP